MIALLIFVLLLSPEGLRVYHPISLTQMAAESPTKWAKLHTHVRVQGWVTYKKREDDGDLHVRLCDSAAVKGMDRKHCIVAEFIPSLPVEGSRAIRIGRQIVVYGIYRYDAERAHGWAEVHPVESLETISQP